MYKPAHQVSLKPFNNFFRSCWKTNKSDRKHNHLGGGSKAFRQQRPLLEPHMMSNQCRNPSNPKGFAHFVWCFDALSVFVSCPRIKGGYRALDMGFPHEAMVDMTGGVAEVLSIALLPRDLLAFLKHLLSKGALINCANCQVQSGG